jgi:hypothetical protein
LEEYEQSKNTRTKEFKDMTNFLNNKVIFLNKEFLALNKTLNNVKVDIEDLKIQLLTNNNWKKYKLFF